ncbi:MAG: hypothetical protein HDS71_01925 [Bacteroidales bacterium]|nr:hypothetical protein [Bacteroidales bacterium]MBD5222801.1 hypothetical protein [Bacteroidales bacterium]MBD5302191.1 hypothetical protein [Bacteroides sp.]
MRNYLLLGALLACGMALTSCSDNASDPSSETTNPIPTYNLFTDATGSSAPFVGTGIYRYTMTFPANTVSVSVSSMPVPGGATLNFATDPVKFTASYLSMPDGKRAEVIKFGNVVANTPAVSNLNCVLTQAAYAPEDVTIPGIEKRYLPSELQHFTVMQYDYNHWKVRTFWPDMTFHGTTNTSGVTMAEPFSTTITSYRIVMHINDDKSIGNKADIIIYNSAFAANMPSLNIVVKDLDLTFSDAGYEVSGSDVVPYMIEAGELQPTPRFIFNNIRFSVTGDLTDVNAYFQVAQVFNGSFTGSSILSE